MRRPGASPRLVSNSDVHNNLVPPPCVLVLPSPSLPSSIAPYIHPSNILPSPPPPLQSHPHRPQTASMSLTKTRRPHQREHQSNQQSQPSPQSVVHRSRANASSHHPDLTFFCPSTKQPLHRHPCPDRPQAFPDLPHTYCAFKSHFLEANTLAPDPIWERLKIEG